MSSKMMTPGNNIHTLIAHTLPLLGTEVDLFSRTWSDMLFHSVLMTPLNADVKILNNIIFNKFLATKDNGDVVKHKAHMDKPYLREDDEEDSAWMNSFDLGVSDIREVQRKKSLFDVSDGGGGPEEYLDDASPDG